MTHPGGFTAGCWICVWESDAVPTATDAEQLAGSHDDRVHDGLPTAWVEPVEDEAEDNEERRAG